MRLWAVIACAVCALLAATTGCVQSAGPTGAAQSGAAVRAPSIPTTGSPDTGRAIFQNGMTDRGQLQFSGGTPAARNGACANCHGANAQGLIGPTIAYGAITGKGGSSTPPRFTFTNPGQIYVAVTRGIAPDGSQLHNGMPRFDLTVSEFADLLAYLKTL